ncbi:MAG: hypothetical protein IIA59_01610 [Candidatus Marinimicrobia bacterium]|nr:hypothetical protein [Candidatus Neomarinimicrobiota bacterium]
MSKMSHLYMNNADSSREVEENGVGLVLNAGYSTYFLSPLPGVPRLSFDVRFAYDSFLKQYYSGASIGILLFGRAD